jgi:Tfp pilus assembly protein PilF
MGDWEAAGVRLKTLKQRLDKENKPQRKALVEYYARLATLRQQQRNLVAADAAYRQMLRVNPNSAWNHGNYASFLLFQRGNADGAITEANRALGIREYGMGRWTLGAAQYCKWAQLRSARSVEAQHFLNLARANSPDPDSVMVQAGLAAGSAPSIRKMIEALRETGVSLDARDEHGDTGLSLAAYFGETESAKWLLGQGADLNVKDAHGLDIMSMALTRNHLDVAKLLIAHGADVNKIGYASRSPLYVAASVGNPETVEVLIEAKAALDIGAPGETPLMVAARANHPEAIRVLLRAGADPTIGVQRGVSAADSARTAGNLELANELIEAQKAWDAAKRK